MRELPDPDLSLRDASDFVFDSELGRKALSDPNPKNIAIPIREVVALVYKLTASCQLPEFTDHGLPHLCSLIDRISRWTLVANNGVSPRLIDMLTAAEAGQLLVAVLFHDVGMLSQRPEDMPAGAEQPWQSKGVRDIPGWVRTTHIPRMRSVIQRSFQGTALAATIAEKPIERAMSIATAHGSWPWEPGFSGLSPRESGLAAVLAIADLLDEDSNRCDIGTLLNHRLGTHLNCAHWIRHGLTDGRVLVVGGTISVNMARPPGTDGQLAGIFSALRNHFRLAFLYQKELQNLGAGLLGFEFSPLTGCPKNEALELVQWAKVSGFNNQSALVFHILSSFMPIALLDDKKVAAADLARARAIGLEPIDLSDYYAIRGTSEPRSNDEQVFRALSG